MNSEPDRPLRILLVEDQEVDQILVQRAFKKTGVHVDLTIARDGVEGLERLRGSDGFPPVSKPCLVLLDLNMPRMGGIEFLDNLRSDPLLQHTVVFILTTSDHEADREACYARGVAGFIPKQQVTPRYSALAEICQLYWDLVHMPV